MGETIRYLMVAVFALISIVGIGPVRLIAQGPSLGFEIPKSLSGAFGATAESAAATTRGNSGSAASTMPNFTSGFDTQRVGPRTGGPTTDPITSRDNAWLTETATSGVVRPTTEPVGSNAFGSQSAATQRNELRSNQNRNTIATVGATQDPQSREAQLMAIAQNNGTTANTTGSNASRGFGSLPSGVRLPGQGDASGANATFGSEFARGAAAPPLNNQPVYGPPTAQEANYDLSVYNAKNSSNVSALQNSAAQNYGQGSARTTAQQDLLLPGGFTRGATTGQVGVNGSALGMPAADPRAIDPRASDPRAAASRANAPTVPSNWTYDQIAQLGRLFGIQPTDPRMGDKTFVNDLYVSYREYQAKQQATTQQAADPMANTPATGRWPAASVASAGQGQFTLPPGQLPTNPSQPSSAGVFAVSDPRYANLGGVGASGAAADPWASPANPSRRPDVDPRLSQKDIDGLPPGAYSYDKYGNPIDKDRYIVDRFGERVDEETQWELTIGRKRRQEEERLAKLDAEQTRAALPKDPLSGQLSPSDRLTAGDRISGWGQPANGTPGVDTTAMSNRPPVAGAGSQAGAGQLTGAGTNGPLGQGNRGPSADQAGLGGAANAIGRSNPYVNVFLLCSLVANAFLFISLHRLWYHHRDLIASSRVAASGMSGND